MISRARRELFDLFEQVVSKARARVLIGHRDYDDQAVLISRKELERLEERARAAETTSPFALAGTATISGAPEDVLTGVRRRQADLLETKARASRDERSRWP